MDKLDILNREAFVEQLVNLVEKIAEGGTSVSFAIDGIWGCGKSFILDMLEGRLTPIQSEKTLTDKYLIIRYNCWKYDYYEEPLVAIVATIIDTIDEKAKLLSGEQCEKVKGILKVVGTTLLSIPNSALKTATGIDFKETFNVLKSGIDAGEEEYDKIQEYDMFLGLKQTLHRLQKVLFEISKQYTLVFLVDELDRCLPEYTIKVLERLHHLTESTRKVINIIAIDKGQLKASVEHIFGFSDADRADKYLKKFIHFSIPLDFGSPSEKIVDKYSNYISLFDKTLIPIKESIEEYMQALFTNIDAREQEQLIQRAMLVHKLLYSGDKDKDYSFMCMELLIITIESCYQRKKIFTKWFQKFNFQADLDTKTTPFSSFFNEEFDKVPHSAHSLRIGVIDEYVFQSADSLYGAIAYTWYELFLKKPLLSISISNGTTRSLLANNVVELKKFVEMINLIK